MKTNAAETGSRVIAIDGPAASGKGTLARRIAAALGYALLDTGALYRTVALTLLRQGGNPDDSVAAVRIAESLTSADIAALSGDPDLRSDQTGMVASRVSAIEGVRAALLTLQRSFARHPPGGLPGAVLDGRDIGTVICPDADAKLFVTADVAVRAQRRQAELAGRGDPISLDDVLADMQARDERDTRRDIAPLRPADDAVLLDTSALTADQVFDQALSIIRTRLGT
jgi:CMP/dCMP kinase